MSAAAASSSLNLLSTSQCFLPYLNSQESKHQDFALKKLSKIVDSHWYEIAESLTRLEEIASGPNAHLSQLASYIISKTFYFLGEYDESLNYALLSGANFDLNSVYDYESTIATKAIDKFVDLKASGESISPTLNDFISRVLINDVTSMVTTSTVQEMTFDVLGIIIKANMIDLFKEVAGKLVENAEKHAHLVAIIDYVFYSVKKYSTCPEKRSAWLKVLVEYTFAIICKTRVNLATLTCMLIMLEDVQFVISVLNELPLDESLQVAFDLYDNCPLFIINKVKSGVKNSLVNKVLSGDVHTRLRLLFLVSNNKSDLKTIKQIRDISRMPITNNAITIANGLVHFGTGQDKFLRDNLDWLSKFVCWPCFTASGTLGQIHQLNEPKSMEILESYLPSNPENGLENSTPLRNATKNEFSQSGAFFALGLINSCRNLPNVTSYLSEKIDANSGSETLLYGISAGLGLSAGLSHNKDIVEKLKNLLFSDQTMPGFMSSIGIGLVMTGAGKEGEEEFDELLEYSLETKHEKIILGCGLGQALIVAQRPDMLSLCDKKEDGSATNFSRMANHIEAYVRLSAVNCIASAYVGQNDPAAIMHLLNFISNDVSEIVRRGATIGLGFVLVNHHSQAIELIEPLLVHHCQHIRFGACIALGICFASTGSSKVLQLLKPLQMDMFAYVKQALAIAAAMILNSHNESTSSQFASYQEWIMNSNLSEESQIMKFGSIIGLGLMNAGGQNMNLSIFSNLKTISKKKMAGMLIFAHYWFWYPFIQYIGLSLETSEVILLNNQLDVISTQMKSDVPKSARAYLKRFKSTRCRGNDHIHEAVLSIVKSRNRSSARSLKSASHLTSGSSSAAANKNGPSSAKKDKVSSKSSDANNKLNNGMVTEDFSKVKEEKPTSSQCKKSKKSSEREVSAKHDPKQSSPKAAEPNPKDSLIENMSRVLPVHRKSLTLADNISMMRKLEYGGIVICKNKSEEQLQTLFNALDDQHSLKNEANTMEVEMKDSKEAETAISPPKSFTFEESQVE